MEYAPRKVYIKENGSYTELSEREWSSISGIPQKTINDRKRRILAKLKKILEK
ncbi:MAG: hypothetical protein K2I03_05475 [Lachnospiraceae bacterium]|nr:hypothetical protein [Lachnospiraceae bacterium]